MTLLNENIIQIDYVNNLGDVFIDKWNNSISKKRSGMIGHWLAH